MKKFAIIILALILAVVILSPVMSDTAVSPKTETIGVLVNFFPEIKPFLEKFGEKAEMTRVNHVNFYRVKEGNKNVIVFMPGADESAAAAGLQLAIDRFGLDKVIVGGLCGAVSPDLTVGDVVIPERWANHTYAYLAPENRNFAPFFKPLDKFPAPYGDMYHDMKELPLDLTPSDNEKRMMWFDVDKGLLETARNLKDVDLIEIGGKKPGVKVGGNGVSGAWFVDNYKYRMHLYKYFNAEIVDMESQSLCQTALTNGKPILVVRAVSDYAGSKSGERNVVRNNIFDVADNSSRAIWEIIKSLP